MFAKYTNNFSVFKLMLYTIIPFLTTSSHSLKMIYLFLRATKYYAI